MLELGMRLRLHISIAIAIEWLKEVEHLQALINANEGYEVEQRPEVNGEGSNSDAANQTADTRTDEN